MRRPPNRRRIASLSQDEFASLGNFLNERLQAQGCDCTRSLTKRWLLAVGAGAKAHAVLEQLARAGGCCCDCEVLHNVIVPRLLGPISEDR